MDGLHRHDRYLPSRSSCTIRSYGALAPLAMTTLEEAQAKLALATLKLEKLHDDYQTVNPEAIYWLLRMKRAGAAMREASHKLMELESLEIPSKANEN